MDLKSVTQIKNRIFQRSNHRFQKIKKSIKENGKRWFKANLSIQENHIQKNTATKNNTKERNQSNAVNARKRETLGHQRQIEENSYSYNSRNKEKAYK